MNRSHLSQPNFGFHVEGFHHEVNRHRVRCSWDTGSEKKDYEHVINEAITICHSSRAQTGSRVVVVEMERPQENGKFRSIEEGVQSLRQRRHVVWENVLCIECFVPCEIGVAWPGPSGER